MGKIYNGWNSTYSADDFDLNPYGRNPSLVTYINGKEGKKEIDIILFRTIFHSINLSHLICHRLLRFNKTFIDIHYE